MLCEATVTKVSPFRIYFSGLQTHIQGACFTHVHKEDHHDKCHKRQTKNVLECVADQRDFLLTHPTAFEWWFKIGVSWLCLLFTHMPINKCSWLFFTSNYAGSLECCWTLPDGGKKTHFVFMHLLNPCSCTFYVLYPICVQKIALWAVARAVWHLPQSDSWTWKSKHQTATFADVFFLFFFNSDS